MNKYIRIYTHMYVYTCRELSYTWMYMNKCIWTKVYEQRYMNIYMNIYMNKCIWTDVYEQMYTYLHTVLHTYICMYTQVGSSHIHINVYEVMYTYLHTYAGSSKLQVSFAEYRLFCRALLLSSCSLLMYTYLHTYLHTYVCIHLQSSSKW